jgi:hypothetical protein|tara:strand:+ start:400 stop:561 length:162 start_codon:yes stop_codon:yes gene_type:complete
MTNKYKNKIKNMKFLSQTRTRITPEKLDINSIKEHYRDKETNEELHRFTRRVI